MCGGHVLPDGVALEPVHAPLTLLEINARFNLWHYLGAANGVNLPQVAYEYLVHRRLPLHAEARLRYRWVDLRYDWKARRAGIGTARWLWSLACAPKVYNVFAWRDPAPFLHECAVRARRIPRRLRRIVLAT